MGGFMVSYSASPLVTVVSIVLKMLCVFGDIAMVISKLEASPELASISRSFAETREVVACVKIRL
jgi:hypothetical protein